MGNIYNYTLNELEQYFITKGEKGFKAVQLFDWLYKKRINTFDDMSNLKKNLIETLKADYKMSSLKIITKETGKDVYKYLFELEDKSKIEAVLMLHDYGNSLCVSSQVGCNMGCLFCESGRLKRIRNLETYEMVLQFLQIEADLNIKISHVVLMGIGEPFDNYENIIKFIDIISCNKGIDLGIRHITVSTCGIVPKIKEFMNYGKQVNLAISLHAPNDQIRDEIMPINKVYKLDLLIKTLKEYIKVTNRRVTFEYVLLDNINDSYENAIELSNLLKGMNCYVNLIPYNETSHSKFKKSNEKKTMQFYDTLKKQKINVTIRKEFGQNLNAACGQLRANYKEELQ